MGYIAFYILISVPDININYVMVHTVVSLVLYNAAGLMHC